MTEEEIPKIERESLIALKNKEFLKRMITAEKVVCFVFNYYEVDYSLSKNRSQKIDLNRARQVSAHVLKKLYNWEPRGLSELFNRERTSGYHLFSISEGDFFTDKQLEKDCMYIIKTLKDAERKGV